MDKLKEAIAELDARVKNLQAQRAKLAGIVAAIDGTTVAAVATTRTRRPASKATKAKLRAAALARWAKVRKDATTTTKRKAG